MNSTNEFDESMNESINQYYRFANLCPVLAVVGLVDVDASSELGNNKYIVLARNDALKETLSLPSIDRSESVVLCVTLKNNRDSSHSVSV